MRRFLLLLVFTALTFLNEGKLAAQSYWQQLGPFPFQQYTTPQFNSIVFDSTGSDMYLSCAMFGICHSTDDGSSWEFIDSQEVSTPSCLAVDAAGQIYAGTYTPDFYQFARSDSKGRQWQYIGQKSSKLYPSVFSIAVAGGGLMYAGTSNQVCRSTDSGNTWSYTTNGLPKPSGTSDPQAVIANIFISKSGTVFAIPSGHGLYRSSDNGNTWQSVSGPLGDVRVMAMTTLPGGILVAAEKEYGLFRSDDDGIGWHQIGLPPSYYVTSLASTRTGELIAGSNNIGMIHSLDTGRSWHQLGGGLTTDRVGLVAIGPDGRVYAVVNDSLVFRSRSLSLSVALSSDPSDLIVSPNPSDGVFAIENPSGNVSSITITDVLGRNVLQQNNLRLTSTTINLSALPAGTYMLRATDVNGTIFRKIVKR